MDFTVADDTTNTLEVEPNDNNNTTTGSEEVDEDTKAMETNGSTMWDGGPPMPPHPPDIVTNDVSCQGTIAITLQEALDELQHHDTLRSFEAKYSFQLDCAKAMRSFGESIVQQQETQYDAQFDAMTQHRQRQQQRKGRNIHHFTNSTASTDSTSSTAIAPAAVLRGRVNHYNRFGTKWRIVVENVEIVSRRPIDGRQAKRNRASLWDVMSQLNTDEGPVVKIPRLEVLVYNDIE